MSLGAGVSQTGADRRVIGVAQRQSHGGCGINLRHDGRQYWWME